MGKGRKRGAGSVRSPEDLRLPAECLHWRCDESWLDFESTVEVEPIVGIIGQEDALEALKFGLEINSPGQNVFVRGLAGTGRSSLLRQLLEEIQPACPLAPDRCYVHDFEQPDRPRLITLPRGNGRRFQARMDRFIEFMIEELGPALASEGMRNKRESLDDHAQDRMRQLGKPFEEELQANGLVLAPAQVGQTVQPVILPLIDGQPVPPDQFKQLRLQGKISDSDAEAVHEKISGFEKRFQEVRDNIEEIQNDHRTRVRELYETEARAILSKEAARIEGAFPYDDVKRLLSAVVDDVVGLRLKSLGEDGDFSRLYRVNLVAGHEPDDPCPLVVENAPTVQHLLGSIEREFSSPAEVRSDHLMIRSGSLLRADGGFLILEARDVLNEPGAWKALVRTLRTNKLEIVSPELATFWTGPLLKPEPIDINVKVILVGDPGLYYALDAYDSDFSQLFKVLADFDTTIPRDEEGVRFYAGVLAKIVKEENLPPFTRCGVAALAEHGARIAARSGRLTTRFGRVADIAREAAHLTVKKGGATVTGAEVRQAFRNSKRRADLPARRFRKLVAERKIRIETSGWAVGQINGLAVIQAGPMIYGFPSRITATIGPGSAGAINIEREAQLSGAIHTKGFYILGGLLRHLLRTHHPLVFSASIAFEQSYGGIDGDSASGAEICCLLSALTGVPLRQDLAMTGAIDQVGHVQPVGAVTEKVEGFFDTCNDLGLTGKQGVIIPKANAGDMMLREDIVEACEQGRFHVYAVETVHEALELFSGRPAGELDESGHYPEETLLQLAEKRALEYWRMATTKPARLTEEEPEDS